LANKAPDSPQMRDPIEAPKRNGDMDPSPEKRIRLTESAPLTRDQILARFIRLCADIIATPDPREAAALLVNRLSELVSVDRSVLVRLKGRQPIAAVTGGGAAAQDSAFADALLEVRSRFGGRPETVIVPPIDAGNRRMAPHLWGVQQAMGGTSILWMPLNRTRDDSSPREYALWLERWQGRPWDRSDVELLQHASLFLAHGVTKAPGVPVKRSRIGRIAAALCLIALLLFPVTESITATGIVIPDQPRHVFAPMDGILKELHARPGQWVKEGDLLFRYDARVLDKRLAEAFRNVASARAKLARLQGAAYRDPEARAELPVQELEVTRAEADARFYESMRDQGDVRSANAGVVILDDPGNLIGAALQTGQAVLSVADPSRTRLRMLVAASDIGLLKKGSQLSLRLDSSPLKRYSAMVTQVGFDVVMTDDHIPSVTVEAAWVGDPPEIQPGQRGLAKIFGGTTLLGLQILRKPIIALRRLTGI